MSHVERPARMATATPTVTRADQDQTPPDRPEPATLVEFLARALNSTPALMDDLCRYLSGLCEGCEYDQNDWVNVPYDSLSDLISAYRGAVALLKRAAAG